VEIETVARRRLRRVHPLKTNIFPGYDTFAKKKRIAREITVLHSRWFYYGRGGITAVFLCTFNREIVIAQRTSVFIIPDTYNAECRQNNIRPLSRTVNV